MRRFVAVCLAVVPSAGLAQGVGAPPAPPRPVPPLQAERPPFGSPSEQGAGSPADVARQGAGGCFGCSYSGDYYGPRAPIRRPAPPRRLQGEWRNGLWYY